VGTLAAADDRLRAPQPAAAAAASRDLPKGPLQSR
jgi:hypothetical protein